MAKHVRRAMLPGNDEVFQRSFAEGNATAPPPPCSLIADAATLCTLQSSMESKYLIFTGLILLMPSRDL